MIEQSNQWETKKNEGYGKREGERKVLLQVAARSDVGDVIGDAT